MEIIERITFEQVKEQVAASKYKMIFYGANTCWWTHDPEHLGQSAPANEVEVERMASVFQLNAKRGNPTDAEFVERARRATAHRLPCDPRGGMLFETHNWLGFLTSAQQKAGHYGKHRMRAFMAAHHQNAVQSLDNPIPWCESEWQAYNDALDRLIARTG